MCYQGYPASQPAHIWNNMTHQWMFTKQSLSKGTQVAKTEEETELKTAAKQN